MKYEANAGPPKGDHPTDRAINALPLPQYPIAPPVAAGSVDMGNLTMWLKALYHAADGHQFNERLETALYHINLYAEQAKEKGKQEALDLTISVGQLRQRAEKAEAERDTLKESLRLVNVDHGLWMTRTHAAEDARDDALARVKELEADAMRWRYLRDIDHDLTGTAGQPCVALPKGMNSGYYLTGPEAIYAVDMSMAEAAQK